MKAIKYLIITNLGRYILGAIFSFIGGILSRDGLIGEMIANPNSYHKLDYWGLVMYAGVLILAGQFGYHVTYAIMSNINRK